MVLTSRSWQANSCFMYFIHIPHFYSIPCTLSFIYKTPLALANTQLVLKKIARRPQNDSNFQSQNPHAARISNPKTGRQNLVWIPVQIFLNLNFPSQSLKPNNIFQIKNFVPYIMDFSKSTSTTNKNTILKLF